MFILNKYIFKCFYLIVKCISLKCIYSYDTVINFSFTISYSSCKILFIRWCTQIRYIILHSPLTHANFRTYFIMSIRTNIYFISFTTEGPKPSFPAFLSISSLIKKLRTISPFIDGVEVLSTFLCPVTIETRQEIDESCTTLCQATNSCLPVSPELGRRKGTGKKKELYTKENTYINQTHDINHFFMYTQAMA